MEVDPIKRSVVSKWSYIVKSPLFKVLRVKGTYCESGTKNRKFEVYGTVENHIVTVFVDDGLHVVSEQTTRSVKNM